MILLFVGLIPLAFVFVWVSYSIDAARDKCLRAKDANKKQSEDQNIRVEVGTQADFNEWDEKFKALQPKQRVEDEKFIETCFEQYQTKYFSLGEPRSLNEVFRHPPQWSSKKR